VKFSEVVGQETLKDKLVQTVHEGRISHAQVFLGSEGTGALPMALAYAQFLNCLAPTENDSCGSCSSCVKYSKLIHPDLHLSFPFIKPENEKSENAIAAHFLKEFRETFLEDPYINYDSWIQAMGGGNKQGNINKAECLEIISKLGLHTFEAKYKVLIMWLPEYLQQIGNILLKIIEEPPAGTVFLLVAERPELLLSTLLSRTQLVKVPRLSVDSITTYLINNCDLSQKEAHSIALLSEGNLRSARALVQHEVSLNESLFINFMRAAYRADGNAILAWLDKSSEMSREQQKNFLQYGLHLIRECFLMQYGSAKLVRLRDAELEFVTKFSPFILKQHMQDYNRILNDAIYYVERNANGRLVFHNLANEIERLLTLSRKTFASTPAT
jgi:DNA polymerase-3 subunit delta'